MAIKVTQIKSGSGSNRRQLQTLKGLGLGRIGRTRILKDTPSVRGLVGKVLHLVQFEEVTE